MSDDRPTDAGLARRSNRLMVTMVIALAVVGYVVGLRAGVPDGPPGLGVAEPASASARAGIPSPTYDEVGAGRLRADDGLETWHAMTRMLRPAAAEPSTDMDTRLASLATRAERRAFNGAPPQIPHATHALDDRSCLACHGQDLQLAGRSAKKLPHPHFANCTQCHAPAAPPFLADTGGMLAESAWAGIAAPRQGVRAGPGAPPAVPHTLQMRDNCLACHGPSGWPGMQTSHPERQNCLQCHAPTEDGAHPGRGASAPFLLPPLPVAGTAPR